MISFRAAAPGLRVEPDPHAAGRTSPTENGGKGRTGRRTAEAAPQQRQGPLQAGGNGGKAGGLFAGTEKRSLPTTRLPGLARRPLLWMAQDRQASTDGGPETVGKLHAKAKPLL